MEKLMKTGLVIEGGGVRAIYAAGVLDVFMEHQLRFDGVIGVSAGAIHGCSFLSGQKGRSLRFYKKYCNDPRFMGFRSWLTTGDIVGTDFGYREIPDRLDIYDYEAFKNCEIPFYAACSNVVTGQPEYLQITDMRKQMDCLRASASLPYFSRIVEIAGKKYLDGGATDSIPVEAFMNMGYQRNVVILTREAAYRKKPELRMLPDLVYRKYPAFAEALRKRHISYNHTLERILDFEKEGSIFVIRPEVSVPASRMERNPENVQRAYDMGYADAKQRIDQLLKWMEQKE